MIDALQRVIGAYNPKLPLAEANTPPAAWYLDPRIADLERRAVFARAWQPVARLDQLAQIGDYVTADITGEPIVVVRGRDHVLRAFHNVCRHHAAAVATEPCGNVSALTCPYHGWTYGLDGALKGVPQFDGVCNFDKSKNGLVPARIETWEAWAFVCLDPAAPSLSEHLGDMAAGVAKLNLHDLRFAERRSYDLACNWKVYVDNYLDGGYHVPFIHKGLAAVLDDRRYTIHVADRYCLQSSPLSGGGDSAAGAIRNGDSVTSAVRRGDTAFYYWLYPNFMLNAYEGVMDVNLVLPLAVDRCRVIFDFYFAAAEGEQLWHRFPTGEARGQSIAVAERIQHEDVAICESVQRGLSSRSYDTGRLSVRREAGEHLFHRLLYADLTKTFTNG